jgi:hypothetical protein
MAAAGAIAAATGIAVDTGIAAATDMAIAADLATAARTVGRVTAGQEGRAGSLAEAGRVARLAVAMQAGSAAVAMQAASAAAAMQVAAATAAAVTGKLLSTQFMPGGPAGLRLNDRQDDRDGLRLVPLVLPGKRLRALTALRPGGISETDTRDSSGLLFLPLTFYP